MEKKRPTGCQATAADRLLKKTACRFGAHARSFVSVKNALFLGPQKLRCFVIWDGARTESSCFLNTARFFVFVVDARILPQAIVKDVLMYQHAREGISDLFIMRFFEFFRAAWPVQPNRAHFFSRLGPCSAHS